MEILRNSSESDVWDITILITTIYPTIPFGSTPGSIKPLFV